MLSALKKAGRTDLIGNGPDCLVKPDNNFSNQNNKLKKKKTIRNVHKKKK